MKKWSIGKRTTAGFALALFFIATLGIVTWRNTASHVASTGLVTHTYDVIAEVEATLSLLKDVETGQRGYVITGDAAYLAPYEAAVAEMSGQLANVRQLTKDNPAQQRRLDQLAPLITRRLEFAKDNIATRKEKGLEAAQAQIVGGTGKTGMDQIRKIITEMHDEESTLLKSRSAEADATTTRMTWFAVLGATLAGVLLSFIAWFIVRTIATEIGRGRAETAQTTGAAGEISRIAETVSQDSETQLRSLEQGVGAVNEIAASLKETATQAESVAASTEELVSSINEMAASIEQVTANTTSVATSVAETAAAIEESSASIQSVAVSSQEMAASAQQVTTSTTELAASVKSVKADTEALTSSIDETAAATE